MHKGIKIEKGGEINPHLLLCLNLSSTYSGVLKVHPLLLTFELIYFLYIVSENVLYSYQFQ